MTRTQASRKHTVFASAVFLTFCFVQFIAGCNSASSPPPDTTPPTAPTGLVVTVVSSTQINLSWSASTDNVGVTGYKVQRCSGSNCTNFSQIATPTSTSFDDTGLSASTSYSYRVQATDAAGNLSGFSGTSSGATPASAGPISVSISPKRGGVVISQTIGLSATVNNDVGSAGVTWSKTGGTFTNTTSTSVTFSSTTAGPFAITATSNADNTKSVSVTIGVTYLAGVTTYHNNLARDGTNTREFALTPSTVTSSTFGKLFSCAVDGNVYAQPLWMPNLTIGGGTHNVVFVATENDSVYAFDADASPCHQYWKKGFLGTGVTPVPFADTGSNDINKPIGITGTPVIDVASQTLYVVAKTKEGTGNYHQRLHALSLIDATEKFAGPVDITPAITVPGTGDHGDGSTCTSSPGNVPFCPLKENQRPGLALVGGNVYVAWASHGDNQPYHGWIMRFNASNLAQAPILFNDSPNGRESGIWMSGGAPAFDSSNNVYVITGNGDYDGVNDFGDSILRLNNSLVLQDWFTPNVQGTLDAQDLDLGSGGAVVLVDLPNTSPFQHILIGGGKGVNTAGTLYVINRDPGMMGQLATPDKSIQQFDLGGMIYSTAAFWQNTMYIAAVGQPLSAYALNPATSMFNTSPVWQSAHGYGFPGATPSVSSQGVTQGVVWAIDTNSTSASNASGADGPAVLFAYDPQNAGALLYTSDSTAGAANAAGNAVKFAVPTVANGKVYIGTQTELSVFGLLP